MEKESMNFKEPNINDEKRLFNEEIETLQNEHAVKFAKLLSPEEDIIDSDQAREIITDHIKSATSPSELETIRQKMNIAEHIEL
jgi:hypothetical protein